MGEEVNLSRMECMMRNVTQHYNPERYWRYRTRVIGPHAKRTFFILLRLLYIKRCDTHNNATLGTHLRQGTQFATIPQLPHGLNGIVISHRAVIGAHCCIFHQVTIGEGHGGAPIIGDNVLIGAGSRIIGHVHIGSNVKIGAGVTVMEDIPDNAVVLPAKPTIITKS